MDAPTLERAQEALERADVERAYWEKHFAELLERHPEQFVAVSEGKVVGAAPNLEQIVTMLEQHGVDIQTAWVRFMSKDPRRALL